MDNPDESNTPMPDMLLKCLDELRRARDELKAAQADKVRISELVAKAREAVDQFVSEGHSEMEIHSFRGSNPDQREIGALHSRERLALHNLPLVLNRTLAAFEPFGHKRPRRSGEIPVYLGVEDADSVIAIVETHLRKAANNSLPTTELQRDPNTRVGDSGSFEYTPSRRTPKTKRPARPPKDVALLMKQFDALGKDRKLLAEDGLSANQISDAFNGKLGEKTKVYGRLSRILKRYVKAGE
jgi:hypothetical protein